MKENATQVQLQFSYAAVLHGVEKHKWEMRCPINMKLLIPSFGDSTIDVVDSFCYLQYSHLRKLVKFATLDYMHIPTNMRGHILKNSYDFCKREHFREIADDKLDLLSSAFVYDIIDQQCAAKALQMFSLEVKTYLKDRGHHESAEFVHLVWCWHAACDQCGTCADYRVASFYEMYSFLTKDCNFDHFPSQFCHRNYKGVPIQTFEALLQNITTHIQLYSFATGYVYNPRSILTLMNHSSWT